MKEKRSAFGFTLYGFTLVELMITIAIVAILAGIAYPNYQSYIRKARRAEAQKTMASILLQAERYRATHNNIFPTSLTEAYSPSKPPSSQYYTYSFVSCGSSDPECIIVSAVAIGSQAGDIEACRKLSISSRGTLTPQDGNCWIR